MAETIREVVIRIRLEMSGKPLRMPGLKPLGDQLGGAKQKVDELDKAAAKLFAKTRTPLERYRAEVGKLDRLLEKGKITQETYSRALDESSKALFKNSGAAKLAADQQKRIHTETRKTTTAIGGVTKSSRKGTRAILELSRGAEDAAVSFGTTGVSGAIRGATNNISQMATILNPAAGAIVGFALAGVAIMLPFIRKWIASFDTTNQKLEKQKKLDEELRKETQA